MQIHETPAKAFEFTKQAYLDDPTAQVALAIDMMNETVFTVDMNDCLDHYRFAMHQGLTLAGMVTPGACVLFLEHPRQDACFLALQVALTSCDLFDLPLNLSAIIQAVPHTDPRVN